MSEMKKKVLIVDDEGENVDFIKKGLSRRGFDVDGETDGKKVQSLVQKKFYDIVLLDIIMPDYGGEQVLKDIMTYSPKTKVILISGEAKGSDIVTCIKMGAVDFLEKPIDVNQIATRIHVVSDRPDFCHDPATLIEHLINRSWESVQNEKGPARGKVLEQLVYHIFSSIPFFKLMKMNIRPKGEEIDLELTNKGSDAFWNKAGGIIIVECKNLSAKTTQRAEFDSFYAKLKRRGNLCEIGFFISYNGFSEGFKLSQIANREKTVVMIDKNGLKKLVESNDRVQLLEELIRKSTH